MGGTIGGQQQQQQQVQNSKTDPYAPAQPYLNTILGRAGAIGTDPTPEQQVSVGNMYSAAAGLPNFGPKAGDVANQLIAGGGPNYSGMLMDAYGGLKQGLQGFTRPEYLDPRTTPGLSDAIKQAGNDVSNQINGQFAAAGRDLSGYNQNSVARGVTAAQLPMLLDQYNRNVATRTGAENSLFAGAGTTAGGASSLNQLEVANKLQGLGAAGTAGQLSMLPANMQFAAAQQGYQLPYSNIGALASLVDPIAGLGSTSAGTSNTTQQTQTPLWQALLGGAVGGVGALGQTGAFGSAGWLAGLSDVRAKENISAVGELHDGQKVYSYNYKGDRTPQLGLLAQEVERHRPDAVVEIGGLKHVHYDKATERSRMIGMLDHLLAAA